MKQVIKNLALHIFSRRTLNLIKFDLLGLKTRLKNSLNPPESIPKKSKLHFGCGNRQVDGFLNVDIINSECDLYLAKGRLPWQDSVFDVIVSQHVIEHLELYDELLPLLRELKRTAKKGAEIWLSCPDLSMVCESYAKHKGDDLLKDRLVRFPHYNMGNAPSQHFINILFHQNGEHRNLFDFDLLKWALNETGFIECMRVSEEDFTSRFEEFPIRNDDYSSLYIKANAGT